MRLLIIEDSVRLNRTLSEGFKKEGYIVDSSEDGGEGLHLALSNHYDAIVLDIMLPTVDGIAILRKVRERAIATPVLLLSARDEVDDRVKGLNEGADDYLCKPFSYSELLARVQTLIRRSKLAAHQRISCGQVTLDLGLKQILIDGCKIVLTPIEYRLLEFFIINAGKAFPHDVIAQKITHDDLSVTKNSLEVHISSIRKKLREKGVENFIHNRRGFGYYVEI